MQLISFLPVVPAAHQHVGPHDPAAAPVPPEGRRQAGRPQAPQAPRPDYVVWLALIQTRAQAIHTCLAAFGDFIKRVGWRVAAAATAAAFCFTAVGGFFATQPVLVAPVVPAAVGVAAGAAALAFAATHYLPFAQASAAEAACAGDARIILQREEATFNSLQALNDLRALHSHLEKTTASYHRLLQVIGATSG